MLDWLKRGAGIDLLPGESAAAALKRLEDEARARAMEPLLQRRRAELARRDALGPDGRAFEDYGRLWAEMAGETRDHRNSPW